MSRGWSGGGGGENPATGWSTVYEVDLSTQSSQTFSANGNVTIDGKTWTVANFANSNLFGVTQGSGLQIRSNTTNSSYFQTLRTAPILHTTMSNLGITAPPIAVRVSCHVPSWAPTIDHESFRFGIESNVDGRQQNAHMSKAYSSGPFQGGISTLAQGQSLHGYDITFNGHDVWILEWRLPQNWAFFSGLYSGGWPTDVRLYGETTHNIVSDVSSRIKTIADASVFFTVMSSNGSQSPICTIAKFKIESFG